VASFRFGNLFVLRGTHDTRRTATVWIRPADSRISGFVVILKRVCSVICKASSSPPRSPSGWRSPSTLNNSIAALISVPLQNNFDFGAEPDADGFQYKFNVKAYTLPFSAELAA